MNMRRGCGRFCNSTTGGGWRSKRNMLTRVGTWPYVRTVLVEFPSICRAQQWYDSPEYREIIPLRQRAIDANIVMVRGLSDKE